MKSIRHVQVTLGLSALFLCSAMAEAATRTVCVDVRFRDDRPVANCAMATEVGNLRGCSFGNDITHRGIHVELWDKDFLHAQDDYIGSYALWFNGGSCINFEWDNNMSANAEGEAHPDLYIKWYPIVYGAPGGQVIATDQSGNLQVGVSFRDGTQFNPDIYVANNCATTCWILPGGYLKPSSDPNSLPSKLAMALDSAQHTLEGFGGIMTQAIVMRVPSTLCVNGCAEPSNNRAGVHVPDNRMTDGMLVPHEIGHTIHAQRLNVNNLRDDCTANDGIQQWTLTSPEFDSCTTAEGFATFIGLASWYDPTNAGSTPLVMGANFEDAQPFQTSLCAANRSFPIQAIKSFWDFADANNEAGYAPLAAPADADTRSKVDIAVAWSQFGAGTGNNQSQESDAHGVNVRDYRDVTNVFHGTSLTMFQTILSHNCIDNQDAD